MVRIYYHLHQLMFILTTWTDGFFLVSHPFPAVIPPPPWLLPLGVQLIPGGDKTEVCIGMDTQISADFSLKNE